MKFRYGHLLHFAAAVATVAAICIGCASVGTPDGGRFDDEPPIFTGSTPKRNATGVSPKSVTLDFNELVKIEKASEKVVVSPPMTEQPDIQINNKKIQIRFKDSLKTNTTYSIDFADAIVDNNEGNPLGDFCFSFSTGEQLDTMEVSGYVLNASDLEPVKGILVGIHSNLEDSAFTSKPLERISHTDSEGHFVIRGIAPGSYRIYALQDMDQNYMFSQKSERIAWYDSLIVPSSEQRFREDSVWNDNHELDSLKLVRYTRFMPDDIVLRSFVERPVMQYMTLHERKTHEKMTIGFAIPMDSLPKLKGLNFDESDAFIIEKNKDNDTIVYWMQDTLLYYRDTLTVSLTYNVPDSVGNMVEQTDTLSFVPAKSRARVLSDAARKAEEREKELEKELRRMEKAGDSIGIAHLYDVKIKFLDAKFNLSSTMNVNDEITLEFPEPVLPFEPDSVIHVQHKVDSLYEPMRMVLVQDSLNIRQFRLYAEWRPGEQYKISMDSAQIYGIYGLFNNKFEQEVKMQELKQYSTFTVKVRNPKPGYTVQLYTGKDKVVRTDTLTNGAATFFFLTPGKYYVRMFNDINRNGIWDTGDYALKQQPEEMFYLNKLFELKQNWDHETEMWNVKDEPLFKQKPDDAKSQKSEARKEQKSKNVERDKKMADEQAKKQQRKEDRRKKNADKKKGVK